MIPERRAAEVTAAVSKASAGAIEHLPIARVRNLESLFARVKRLEGGAGTEQDEDDDGPDHT